MNLPIPKDSTAGLVLSGLFGLIFGILLNKGRVADYNVIVNQFRLKDFTVMKIMLTAIIVGGVGVWAMMSGGLLEGYSLKATNLLGVILGSAIFGVGMVVYGFCPGTGIAAAATGRIDAMVGFLGMIAGGIAYAFSYSWINEHILSVAQLGKVRLPEIIHIPSIVLFAVLGILAFFLFRWIESLEAKLAES